MAQPEPRSAALVGKPGPGAQQLLRATEANELVFGVVGHVGSGTSEVASVLKGLLSEPKGLRGGPYEVEILKARDEIASWAKAHRAEHHTETADSFTEAESLQDLGDELRRDTDDHAAVAKKLVHKIRETRARKLGLSDPGDSPVHPDGTRRAYVLDSIRHPAEVQLLREIYREAFVLVGIVCDEAERLRRLHDKFPRAGEQQLLSFMARDERAGESYGQRVADAFHLADFFVDNTMRRVLSDRSANPKWKVTEHLSRLVKIVTHTEIVRPTIHESSMNAAFGARLRSACLSRQVGAALTDRYGNVVATGANEVPSAGGGVYGTKVDHGVDERCAFRKAESRRFCSNTQQQNEVIDELISTVPELSQLGADRLALLKKELRKTRLGELIEFSRAVHAEMDALLSAGRTGALPLGSRLYVTTFPCHYCARHIVCAGVDEVQFIEPYLKSRALELHDDSIERDSSSWVPPSSGGTRVLFRPFIGVAPRLYRRAFEKDRDLKDTHSGTPILPGADWGGPWGLRHASYVELETKLAREDE